ncbi:MAG: single-stranded DNA-binding protein, partial [Mycoplasmatota bacterium]|nr:single-stranded DNA-binding protein [Mycoplasmatota bacterium]
QDGTTRYTTDVRVYQLTFLNNKPKDERPEPEYDGYEPAETEQNVKENDPFADFGESVEISDDDLPF